MATTQQQPDGQQSHKGPEAVPDEGYVAIGKRCGITFERDPEGRFGGPSNARLYDLIDNEDVVRSGIIGDYNALVELGAYLRKKGLIRPRTEAACTPQTGAASASGLRTQANQGGPMTNKLIDETQPVLSTKDINRFWDVVVPHFGLDASFNYNENPSRIKDYLKDYDKTPEAVQTLERLSDQQLLAELAARGLVVSSWSTEDLSFLDDDDSTLELDDGQLERLKTAVLEGCGRGLQEGLGDRGNNFLSEWWEQNKAEMLSAAQAPVTDQVERG